MTEKSTNNNMDPEKVLESQDMNCKLTSRGGKLQSAEAYIVQGLIVQDHAFVSILNELMHGKGGIIWFNNSVRHFG